MADEHAKTPCHSPDCPAGTHPDTMDNHPKIRVYGNWSYESAPGVTTTVADPDFHYDCLPSVFEDMLVAPDGTPLPQHARTVATIAAAREGKHGEELRQHHFGLPDDNSDGEALS